MSIHSLSSVGWNDHIIPVEVIGLRLGLLTPPKGGHINNIVIGRKLLNNVQVRFRLIIQSWQLFWAVSHLSKKFPSLSDAFGWNASSSA